MKTDLPKRIIRLDDGVVFALNERTGTYSIEADWAKNFTLQFDYSYERLMEDPRSKGDFKVADGTEDLESMRNAWLKRCQSHNDGHGDEDDE
jgi:hypothetical protein